MPVKNISLLGSTGSIGVNTLDVVAAHPDRFRMVALAAGRNYRLLAQQAKQFRPEVVAIWDESLKEPLLDALEGLDVEVLCGKEGVIESGRWPSAQQTISAIVGAAGLAPTLAAIRAGKEIGLANKECLVMAGDLFMEEIARAGVTLIPVDSEHSAIFQSLFNGQVGSVQTTLTPSHKKEIRHLTLTASGGPFRGWKRTQLQSVTPAQALAHPNWSMGRKISIDSATMMNKGLEVIEAYYLFGVAADKIQVVVHPESIIHSMASYHDGSVMAQLGAPDMRTPIAVALAWPERVLTEVPPLDLVEIGKLHFFSAPDEQDFPCLSLAFRALAKGGGLPAVLNAANEVAVEAFLEGEISFLAIPCLIEWVMEKFTPRKPSTIEEIMKIDGEARILATSWILQQRKE
ncbi:MAG: 1-deoxy-D-xylulose-5-phosphate reductoisomerase [Magnetococcales bacterium]|nr:1-deoxy-D-xylulose-5-phosphate reductoisomerase [Magnetococcales bacterium]